MAISNRLKEIRKERQLLQEDIANATGSCIRTISRIERCEFNPSLEMAFRISHFLNLSIEEIFIDEESLTKGDH